MAQSKDDGVGRMTNSGTGGVSRAVERSVEANRAMHTKLAERYEDVEPHFRPENRAKVRQRIRALAAPSHERLLDVGCGTGFVITVAGDLFGRIDGVDATPAMLARIPADPERLTLHEALVEDLPFPDGTFDVVTAYSFLDHLAEPMAAFEEIRRVLKPQGVFYADLLPNRQFWRAVHAAADANSRRPQECDPLVSRELNEVARHEQALAETYGATVLPGEWDDVEPVKSRDMGFDAEEIHADLIHAGFTSVDVHHDWYLGEGAVLHGAGQELATAIGEHLQRIAPVSSSVFKYLWLEAVR